MTHLKEAHSKGHSTQTLTECGLNLFHRTLRKNNCIFLQIECQIAHGMLIECNSDCRRCSDLHNILCVFAGLFTI